MPTYSNFGFRNGQNAGSKEIFDTGSGKLGDSRLDLPGKLTILLKRGMGRKYISDPEKYDAPIQQKHQTFIDNQLQKASYDKYVKALNIDIDRKKSILDFRSMEYTPEISSALDIYADESTVLNHDGEMINIVTDNVRIKKVLENLFSEVLDVEHNLWHWIRSMCKYGDHYTFLDIKPGKGITGHLDLDPIDIRREESYDGIINSTKFMWDEYDISFAAWQIGHFRLTGDHRRLPYGTSMLESGRMIWKQLTLAEDAMMIYRISRAPERRVFYIDVGNIDPKDVGEYINKVKNTIKRTPQVDQSTGNINQKYNTMAIDEDFFIPRRGDKNSEVDTLPGASNLDDIADIEYMQNKLFAALKVPKAFLTYDEDINAKATLAHEDARFARTINRIQQSVLTTLYQMAIIHLFSLGFRDKEQLMSFELQLTNPSSQSDLQKMEILAEKANVFGDLWDESTLSPISWAWGMKNIFGFSDEEMKIILNQQFLEGKMKLEIEEASTAEETGEGELPAGGGFVGEDGQDLPEQPPEGYEYQDAETGETVAEHKLKLDFENVLKSIGLNIMPNNNPSISGEKLLKSSSKIDSNNPFNYLPEFEVKHDEALELLKENKNQKTDFNFPEFNKD